MTEPQPTRQTRRPPASTVGVATARADKATVAPDAIDQARAVWQPLSSRHLSREDGREIIANMASFFAILQEWKRAEQVAPALPKKSVTRRAWENEGGTPPGDDADAVRILIAP